MSWVLYLRLMSLISMLEMSMATCFALEWDESKATQKEAQCIKPDLDIGMPRSSTTDTIQTDNVLSVVGFTSP